MGRDNLLSTPCENVIFRMAILSRPLKRKFRYKSKFKTSCFILADSPKNFRFLRFRSPADRQLDPSHPTIIKSLIVTSPPSEWHPICPHVDEGRKIERQPHFVFYRSNQSYWLARPDNFLSNAVSNAVTNALTVSGFDRLYSRYHGYRPLKVESKRAAEYAMTRRHHCL